MITKLARDLSKKANDLEYALSNPTVLHDLIEELKTNCEPSLNEFIELAGELVYKPEKYYEFVIKKI